MSIEYNGDGQIMQLIKYQMIHKGKGGYIVLLWSCHITVAQISSRVSACKHGHNSK